VTTMRDRVCLVTGATSGIGLQTSLALAERGATVLMAGIDQTECDRAIDHVQSIVPEAALHPFVADLSRISEVRRLAAAVRSQHPRLHVLVNNAGVFCTRHEVTEDGIERTLAVNYVAPFVLTTSLLPCLVSTGGARVVNVSSVAHHQGRLVLDEGWHRRPPSHGFFAYATSKLAVLLFTRALAQRHSPDVLTSNALHPGVVGTSLVRSAGWPGRLLGWANFLMRSPARGARTSVHLATSPEVATVTGAYFVDDRPARAASRARDPDLAERLWTETVGLLHACDAAGAPPAG
jgi:retinol dehydrogenase 12